MYFQSDLDIFQFDFMFMKPRNMPPMFCFYVETDTESLYYNSSCIQRVGVVKSLVSGAVVIQIFHANIRKGSYVFPRWANGLPSVRLARNLLDRRMARIVPMTPGFQVNNYDSIGNFTIRIGIILWFSILTSVNWDKFNLAYFPIWPKQPLNFHWWLRELQLSG